MSALQAKKNGCTLRKKMCAIQAKENWCTSGEKKKCLHFKGRTVKNGEKNILMIKKKGGGVKENKVYDSMPGKGLSTNLARVGSTGFHVLF